MLFYYISIKNRFLIQQDGSTCVIENLEINDFESKVSNALLNYISNQIVYSSKKQIKTYYYIISIIFIIIHLFFNN